jgi:hypothetical protein
VVREGISVVHAELEQVILECDKVAKDVISAFEPVGGSILANTLRARDRIPILRTTRTAHVEVKRAETPVFDVECCLAEGSWGSGYKVGGGEVRDWGMVSVVVDVTVRDDSCR